MTRNSALLALAYSLILVICEIVINWGGGQTWPFWMVQLFAASALVWGGVRTLSQGSSRLLSAAWGLSVGIFWMSFFSHTEALNSGVKTSYGGGALGDGALTFVLGALLLAAIAGLVMSLSRRSI